jgi:hypothetical protein
VHKLKAQHPPKAQSPIHAQVTTTAFFVEAVWRAAVYRYGAPKEQMLGHMAAHESLRYQGQGERHGVKDARSLLI